MTTRNNDEKKLKRNVQNIKNEELAETVLKHSPDMPNEVVEGDTGPFVPPAGNEHYLRNERTKDNAYIIFGKDKPHGRATGSGALNIGENERIELVCGVGAKKGAHRGVFGIKNKSPKNSNVIDDVIETSPFNDACKIYMARKTNIFDDFSIAETQVASDIKKALGNNNKRDRSGIAIKADEIAIIGTNRIKIVTGPGRSVRGHGSKGELNSEGVGTENEGIDLIGGNSVEALRLMDNLREESENMILQPIVKAYNLEQCIEEILNLINRACAAMQKHILYQHAINNLVSKHTHPHTTIAGPATTSAPLSGEMMSFHANQANTKPSKELYTCTQTLITIGNNYLKHSSPVYIGSRYNKTT